MAVSSAAGTEAILTPAQRSTWRNTVYSGTTWRNTAGCFETQLSQIAQMFIAVASIGISIQKFEQLDRAFPARLSCDRVQIALQVEKSSSDLVRLPEFDTTTNCLMSSLSRTASKA